MGKGDIRTRKGKIYRGTSGKTRPKKKNKAAVETAPETKKKSKAKSTKK